MTLSRLKRAMARQWCPCPAGARRGAGYCVTAGHHRPSGSGDSRPASAAAPGSVRTREGAASADAPARTDPRLPAAAIGLVVLPRLSPQFPSRSAHALLR
jgi:hypothetical protein